MTSLACGFASISNGKYKILDLLMERPDSTKVISKRSVISFFSHSWHLLLFIGPPGSGVGEQPDNNSEADSSDDKPKSDNKGEGLNDCKMKRKRRKTGGMSAFFYY